MPARKVTTEASVEAPKAKVADPSKPREWGAVAQEIKAMKEAGATIPEIAEKLQVSYVLVNQLVLQSYKMLIDSVAVFERQEKVRLGIEE